jgi:acetate kinase
LHVLFPVIFTQKTDSGYLMLYLPLIGIFLLIGPAIAAIAFFRRVGMAHYLPQILTINGGSSSIKFALFECDDALRRVQSGAGDRIGFPDATLQVKGSNPADNVVRAIAASDHAAAINHLKKWIGAFAAALGGVDTLIFAGGIGENSPSVRSRICDGLGFLGIELNAGQNMANQALISLGTSRVPVRVIPTDEALAIAQSVRRVLNLG